ncbi:MAG: radical SAM protein [Oscillospiraceae bacterium]|nr:radical SAM protein [Oscillospiraceae bacterium]
MADVVFVTPNLAGNIQSEHIGTMLLATILRDHGITPVILQYFRFGDPGKDFQRFLDNALSQIQSHSPKIVSFYTRCDTYHISLMMARCLKELDPGIYIVFGGPQSDMSAEDTLSQIDYVDYICRGEGENTVYPFFSSLLAGTPDLSVPGLVYRKDGKVIMNPRPALCDLSKIPDIDYSFFPLPEICDEKTVFSVDVGRGCPFGCTFCSTKTFWGRVYRLKDPQQIVQEIRTVHQRFGISNFNFAHDMFTMKRRQVIETCRLLKELDFPIQWRCSARLDCIDPELIDIMVDAGMIQLYCGIETGSPRMQKLVNKNLKLDRVMDILSYANAKGIQLTTSFIFGFPDETEEDISCTISLMGKIAALRNVVIQCHLCTFMYGTEMTERYRDRLTPTDVLSDTTGGIALAECRDIIEAHPSLFVHFHEYHTELRTALRFLPQFVLMWTHFQPVFQYISEKYPADRLIEMYQDYVGANEEMLCQIVETPDMFNHHRLLEKDNFLSSFSKDENYDKIYDYRRIKLMEAGDGLDIGKPVSQIYCISPSQIHSNARLEDYTRGIFAVTHIKNPNGSVSHRIRSMKA